MVLNMGEEEYDAPIMLGRSFLNTTRAIIYMRLGEVHFQFPSEKIHYYFNSYTTYGQSKKNKSRRNAVHPNTARISSQRMKKKRMMMKKNM
jgi:hypothetical protein